MSPRGRNPLLLLAAAARRPGPLALAAALGAFLALFLLLPLALAIGRGFYDDGRLSLYWLAEALSEDLLLRQLANGLLLACATTGLALLIALPPAVIRQLLKHPLTDSGLAAFLADWRKTGQSIL